MDCFVYKNKLFSEKKIICYKKAQYRFTPYSGRLINEIANIRCAVFPLHANFSLSEIDIAQYRATLIFDIFQIMPKRCIPEKSIDGIRQ